MSRLLDDVHRNLLTVWRRQARTGVLAFGPGSMLPWGVEALHATASAPAWKLKLSYYLVSSEDQMIPPSTQRMMAHRAGATVREVAGSHAIYIAKPELVADIIEAAAIA